MPRDSAGNYTLPPNTILGCSPGQALTSDSVSYTHLTLPTILRV